MPTPLLFKPSEYGDAFAALLSESRLAPLGPGSPNHAAHPLLKSLDLKQAFAPHRIVDEDMARACLAALWLHHDFLEELHVLSQEIHTPTGSCWHGLMHRREPDFENAKYWFRRVGTHPVFLTLREAAADLALRGGHPPGESFIARREWDPFAFVDLCARASTEGGGLEELCRQVQRVEWELLFAFCYAEAIRSSLS